MTLERGNAYEPPTPADFDRTVLGVRVARSDDVTVSTIELRANLVATNASAFRRIVVEQLELGARRIILSLAHCPYVDGRGLGALVGAANDTKRAGGRLVVTAANEDLRTLFSLTKLDKLFEIQP